MSPAQLHHREAFVPADKDLSVFYAQKRRTRCRSPPPVSEFQTKFRNSEDNPYCYVDDGVVVKIGFMNTRETIDDRLEGYARSQVSKG